MKTLFILTDAARPYTNKIMLMLCTNSRIQILAVRETTLWICKVGPRPPWSDTLSTTLMHVDTRMIDMDTPFGYVKLP
jgi:hypothetical protein